MILAAGRGSRLKELTDKTPKPLVCVLGKPLLEYHLEKLEAAGFKEIIINVSWLADKIIDYIENHYKGRLSVKIYHEEEALETGGGVFAALSDLSVNGEPFLVINSDVMSDFDYSNVHQNNCALAHLYLIKNPLHNPDGDFCIQESGVLSLKSTTHSKHDNNALTFSGISILTPQLFEDCHLHKFSLGDLFRKYIEKGAISGEQIHDKWFDVGTIERLELASNWQKNK